MSFHAYPLSRPQLIVPLIELRGDSPFAFGYRLEFKRAISPGVLDQGRVYGAAQRHGSLSHWMATAIEHHASNAMHGNRGQFDIQVRDLASEPNHDSYRQLSVGHAGIKGWRPT